MKCCMVTVYPPEACGIATYSSRLTDKLRSYANVTVIGNRADQHTTESDIGLKILRPWKRNSVTYIKDIFETVKKESPDVIHVQHEYLSYGTPSRGMLFPLLLVFLQLLNRPIVLTMHSVLRRDRLTDNFLSLHQLGSSFLAMKRSLLFFFTKIMIGLVDSVIVHSQEMKTVLIRDYHVEHWKVSTIVHGMDGYPRNTNIVDAKRQLGLSGKLVLLFFGFLVPSKGLEVLLRSFSEISNRIPSAILVVAGGYHPRLALELPGYVGTIENEINRLGISDKVVFENKYISTDLLERYIAAADIVVFPYIDDPILGVSGALSVCAAMGKPVVATRILRFSSDIEDGRDGVLIMPNDENELVLAIARLAENEDLRRRLGKNLAEKALTRSWTRIAYQTYELYLSLIHRRTRDETTADLP